MRILGFGCEHRYMAYSAYEDFSYTFSNGKLWYIGKEEVVKIACEKCFKRKSYKIEVKFDKYQYLPEYPDIVYKAQFERKQLGLYAKMLKNNIGIIKK